MTHFSCDPSEATREPWLLLRCTYVYAAEEGSASGLRPYQWSGTYPSAPPQWTGASPSQPRLTAC